MSNNERRRFFRIDDRLELRLTKHFDGNIQPAEPPAIADMRASDTMVELDAKISDAIDQARQQAPQFSELCDLLNRKLDFVIDALELGEEISRRMEYRELEVNISACGLALETRQVLAAGDDVTLDIRFPPNNTEMRLEASVVRSQELRPGYYTVFLDFLNLSSEDQEFLIQYVLRRQSVYLQRLRQQREGELEE